MKQRKKNVWLKEKIKLKLKIFWKTAINENITYPNSCAITKAFLRGELVVLNIYMKEW